jgi:hypothetical protein
VQNYSAKKTINNIKMQILSPKKQLIVIPRTGDINRNFK